MKKKIFIRLLPSFLSYSIPKEVRELLARMRP